MKQTAGNMGVDMLIIDTGDLHDGAGLSDATTVDGTDSMPIFSEIDYDLLTIGTFLRNACGFYLTAKLIPFFRKSRTLRQRGVSPDVQRLRR